VLPGCCVPLRQRCFCLTRHRRDKVGNRVAACLLQQQQSVMSRSYGSANHSSATFA